MQQLISQFRLHLLLSRVHPCLLFIIALLHLTGSRTREKRQCSFSFLFSFLVYSCAIINSGEHQSVKLEFCISDLLPADYRGINTNVKYCFNSEFSNSYGAKARRVSILMKKARGKKSTKLCCSSKNTKKCIFKLFFSHDLLSA